MRFETHTEFFDRCGDEAVKLHGFGGQLYDVSVEELFQHFKARLSAEVASECAGRLLNPSAPGSSTTTSQT